MWFFLHRFDREFFQTIGPRFDATHDRLQISVDWKLSQSISTLKALLLLSCNTVSTLTPASNFMNVQSLGNLRAIFRYRLQTRTINLINLSLLLSARSKANSNMLARISSGKEAVPVLRRSGMSTRDSCGIAESTISDTAWRVLDNDFIACNVEITCAGSSRQPTSRVEVKGLEGVECKTNRYCYLLSTITHLLQTTGRHLLGCDF